MRRPGASTVAQREEPVALRRATKRAPRRGVIEDMHPSAYWPFVEFERACAARCDARETRCAATQTCLAVGYATCAYCEGQTAEVCACRDTCGTKADGSECSFDEAPDLGVGGTCSAGACVARTR